MGEQEYRDSYQAALDAAAAANPPTSLDDALAWLRDTTQDESTRLWALDVVSQTAATREDALDTLLAILVDTSEPIGLRVAALAGLEVNSFRAGLFETRQAQFTEALKQTVSDEDPTLRERSIEVLAKRRDPDVQRWLIDGLQDPSVAIMAPQQSLELLAFDLKADHFGVLRQVVETNTDTDTRREAIRMLGADQESLALVESVVRNRNEPVELRDAGAATLQAMSPTQFELVAQELVTDTAEDAGLRAAVLTRLAFQPTSQVPDAFWAEVVAARDSGASDEMQRAAQQFSDQQGVA